LLQIFQAAFSCVWKRDWLGGEVYTDEWVWIRVGWGVEVVREWGKVKMSWIAEKSRELFMGSNRLDRLGDIRL